MLRGKSFYDFNTESIEGGPGSGPQKGGGSQNNNDRNKAINIIKSLPSLPAGEDFISSRDLGLQLGQNIRVPTVTKKMLRQNPVTIPLSELKTGQGWLTRSHLLNLISKDSNEPIVVVEQEGQKYIIDGNHRFAAEKAKGNSSISAIVIPARPKKGRYA